MFNFDALMNALLNLDVLLYKIEDMIYYHTLTIHWGSLAVGWLGFGLVSIATSLSIRLAMNFAQQYFNKEKPVKLYAVVRNALTYYSTIEDDSNGVMISGFDLAEDTVFNPDLVFTAEKDAQSSADLLNKEREIHGADNKRWNYYVVELTKESMPRNQITIK